MTSPPSAATLAEHQAQARLSAREPFDWGHSLRFVARFPPADGEQLVDGERLTKAWRVLNQTVVARFAPAADGSPGLDVTLASPSPIGADVKRAAIDRVSFYLSLDDDLLAFSQTAGRDPGFAPVEARLHGYHQVKFGSPAENLVWSILAQRTPLRVARDAKLRLMRHLNPPTAAFGAEFQPFPSLDQLTGLAPTELTELIRNERKAGYLHGALGRLAELDEEFLRHGNHLQVQRTLLAMPGIGPWSAVFILIRGLGRMEYLSQEPELLRAAEQAYGRNLTAPDLATLSASYAPNQGYWAHYLRAGGG